MCYKSGGISSRFRNAAERSHNHPQRSLCLKLVKRLSKTKKKIIKAYNTIMPLETVGTKESGQYVASNNHELNQVLKDYLSTQKTLDFEDADRYVLSNDCEINQLFKDFLFIQKTLLDFQCQTHLDLYSEWRSTAQNFCNLFKLHFGSMQCNVRQRLTKIQNAQIVFNNMLLDINNQLLDPEFDGCEYNSDEHMKSEQMGENNIYFDDGTANRLFGKKTRKLFDNEITRLLDKETRDLLDKKIDIQSKIQKLQRLAYNFETVLGFKNSLDYQELCLQKIDTEFE